MEDNYVLLNPKIMQKGMYPATDLFYVFEGNSVLLCHGGEIINTMALNRLQYIASIGREVYVKESTRKTLEEQARFFLKADHETEERYARTAEACNTFLNDIKDNNDIEKKSVVRLIDLAEHVLDSMDVSFLLQYTHYFENMDNYLQAHTTDVAILNGLMGRWLDLPEEDVRKLITVGFLHDIGKLQIPDIILNKPGRLTPDEFEIIKNHPVYSYNMCIDAGIDDREMLSGIRGHHERLNGTGYPDKLKGNQISSFARVTAISDIYDAMVSERVYKGASTPFEVLQEFYTDQFSNLDMDYVNIFLEKMLGELNGKFVILSNGRMGQIMYIEKKNVNAPVVKCKNGVFQTSPKDLHVVSVCGDTL